VTAQELARRGTSRIQPNSLTFRELAERVGVPVSYISDFERGMRRPSLPVLQQLATTLNVPFAELVALGGCTPHIQGRRAVLVPSNRADVLGRLAGYDRAALLELEGLARQRVPAWQEP